MKMDRQKIFEKFGGKCAYSGTDLKDDWQIDHMEPKIIFQINGKSGYMTIIQKITDMSDNGRRMVLCGRFNAV